MLPNPLQVACIQTSTKKNTLQHKHKFCQIFYVCAFSYSLVQPCGPLESINYVLEVACVLYSLYHKIIAIP